MTCLFCLSHGGQHISSYHNAFSHRCFLWCPLHWYGRSCFIDGERFTGKHTFSVLQHHHLLHFRITWCLTFCFYIQAALSIFGMISGPLLGLYLLGMLFRTPNSIVSILYQSNCHELKRKEVTFGKYFIVRVYLAGRDCGFDHWPGDDFMGGDWWPALPSNFWNDKSSPTYHCGLHHGKLHHGKLHHGSSVNQPRDSAQPAKVSYKQQFSQRHGVKISK